MEQTDTLGRIMQSLNCPVYVRCTDLAVLFDRCNFKDLQTVYPMLIDNIFAPSGGFSWNMRGITSANVSEFNSLQNFFSPVGPFFKVIYKLLQDPKLKYEFPLSYLPTRVRQCLDVGNNVPPPFYNDLINVDLQTRTVTSLLLNPFDYYFFHFAYYLTNPWQQRDNLTWNTIYYVLSCDYLIHFLPTNPETSIYPELHYYNGKNPTQSATLNRTRVTPDPKMKVIRPMLINQQTANFSPQISDHHPRNEIWRSETVITVFVDMWLNNEHIITSQSFSSPMNQQFQYTTLPSTDYVRIVRVLVKQLHSFAASARDDSSNLGELKKIVLPMLQGRMYSFLRNLMHRWPLDGSFRLVLELWLSFIQPWRYSGNTNDVKLNQENIEEENAPTKVVDKEYIPFISENLLAYTVIFQHLLPRFTRTDLVSPKNSLMLYRVTKVFSQPNLISLLKEIETLLSDFNHSPNHSFMNYSLTRSPSPFSSLNTSTPCINYTSTGKWISSVRQKMYDAEGPDFCYKSLFIKPPGNEVYELLKTIKRSLETAHEMIRLHEEHCKTQHTGFSGFIKSLFYYQEGPIDEFTLEDRKKVPVFLEHAQQSLIEMFKISAQTLHSTNLEDSSFSSNASIFESNSSPNSSDISFLMSPKNVRARLQNISYQGDPELQSVRSYEFGALVRLMYKMSSKINEMCGHKLEKLYYNRNFIGKLSRQILSPPIKTYSFNKRVIGSPRVQKNLPPRISLRYFASHNFITLVVLAFIFIYLTKCSKLLFLGVVFTSWCFYIITKAAFSSSIPE